MRVPIFVGPKPMCHFYPYGPSLSDGVLHIMNFGAPIVHCIGLETWSPNESLLWIWLSRVPNFWGPKYVCHFYWYRPSLSDGVLHIMNFGAPIVHCIGLETWSPNESLLWIWLSRVPTFWGPKYVCHFYRYGPSLSDGVLHIMNFGAPIVHCIWLETWFYVNITYKYDRFCVF